MKRGIRFEITFQEGAFSRLLNMLSEETIGGIYSTLIDVVNKAANEALDKAAAQLLDEVAGRSGPKGPMTGDKLLEVRKQTMPVLGKHLSGVIDPHWNCDHGAPVLNLPPQQDDIVEYEGDVYIVMHVVETLLLRRYSGRPAPRQLTYAISRAEMEVIGHISPSRDTPTWHSALSALPVEGDIVLYRGTAHLVAKVYQASRYDADGTLLLIPYETRGQTLHEGDGHGR